MAYSRGYGFSNFQANAPKTPLPGQRVDIELDNIADGIGGLTEGLADVRRSDGKLNNAVVTLDSLDTDVRDRLVGGADAADRAEAALAATEGVLGEAEDVLEAIQAVGAISAETDPVHFGAVGDGVANDTAALAAFRAAYDGTINLYGRTYAVTAYPPGNFWNGHFKLISSGVQFLAPNLEMIYSREFWAPQYGLGPGNTPEANAAGLTRILDEMWKDDNRGGTIVLPRTPSDWIVLPPTDLFPRNNADFWPNVRFKGAGGHHTKIGTRIVFVGSLADNYAMRIRSAVQWSFEDLELVAAGNCAAVLKLYALGDAGANGNQDYSNFTITFRRGRIGLAGYGDQTADNTAAALVILSNTSNTLWEQWSLSGGEYALQLGSNADAAENVGTFSGGAASQNQFVQCLLQGDIKMVNTDTAMFDGCGFDRNAWAVDPVTGAGRGVRFVPAGDARDLQTTLRGVWAKFGDGTSTFYTQGENGRGLYVLGGNYFGTYAVLFDIAGHGYADFQGGDFSCLSAVDDNGDPNGLPVGVGIVVRSLAEGTVHVGPGVNFKGIIDNGGTPIQRETSFLAPSTKPPFLVYEGVPGSSAMSVPADDAYHDVITKSCRLTGRVYEISFAVTISATVDSDVEVCAIFDSQTPRVAARRTIAAGTTEILTGTRKTTAGGLINSSTTARLKVRVHSGDDVLVALDDPGPPTSPGFLQILELG